MDEGEGQTAYRQGDCDGVGYEQHMSQVPSLQDLEHTSADADGDADSNTDGAS